MNQIVDTLDHTPAGRWHGMIRSPIGWNLLGCLPVLAGLAVMVFARWR